MFNFLLFTINLKNRNQHLKKFKIYNIFSENKEVSCFLFLIPLCICVLCCMHVQDFCMCVGVRMRVCMHLYIHLCGGLRLISRIITAFLSYCLRQHMTQSNPELSTVAGWCGKLTLRILSKVLPLDSCLTGRLPHQTLPHLVLIWISGGLNSWYHNCSTAEQYSLFIKHISYPQKLHNYDKQIHK